MTEAYVLFIDDEPEVLAQCRDLLEDEKIQACTAQGWEEALRLLKQYSFNLIVTDIRLPDISGRNLLQRLSEENRFAFVVTTTGFGDIDEAVESLQYGAKDYISKPFERKQLQMRLRKLLDKQRLACDNIQLLDTIKTLARALDARDHYTHGHSQEVTDYSVAIAKQMQLSPREVENIRDAGLLHDIGKIGIADHVLLKPGRLTDEEFEEIKKHPQIGRDILAPVSSLAEKVPLIYHHHERFDGTGYPEGLKGEDIPLGARIIAVADAYQAMTSDRPYRKALPQEVAIAELDKYRGRQFDERIVDAFKTVLLQRATAAEKKESGDGN